jgi:hypothetical protein
MVLQNLTPFWREKNAFTASFLILKDFVVFGGFFISALVVQVNGSRKCRNN